MLRGEIMIVFFQMASQDEAAETRQMCSDRATPTLQRDSAQRLDLV